MVIEYKPGEFTPDPDEEAYLDWLEADVRNIPELRSIQAHYKSENPVLYRIIADAAAELAPGDPRSHATLIGSFLLNLEEKPVNTLEPA
jgi:hypothetical protein